MDILQYFYPDNHENHYELGHPERPDRLFAIRDSLIMFSLWDQYKKLPPSSIDNETLSRTHSSSLISSVQQNSKIRARMDADTYLTTDSYHLALKSAGGAISIAEAVWQSFTQFGIAFCRPPGHHATTNQSMGFCLFNNIAIAANYLIDNYNVKKIAIIDIDVHHGNGTQEIFYYRDDVHFFSIHQSPFYPFSGFIEETGGGKGINFNTNIPLPIGAGDISRQNSFDEIIIPLLDKSKPEIVFVSAGFDAHWKDPLANHLVTASGYGEIIGKLINWTKDNCEGKLAIFLEGGYDLQAGAESCLSIVNTILGKPFNDVIGNGFEQESLEWEKTILEIKSIWSLKN